MPLIFFGFGLIAGSFLNALVHRLHSGQSMFERSSRCPNCNHELAARDLVPLVSFFILRGRCRYCGKHISWQYPLVELFTGIAFVLVFLVNVIPPIRIGEIQSYFWIIGSSPMMTGWVEVVFQLIFVCFLILIFVYDLKHYLILDKVLVPAVILAVVYQGMQGRLQAGVVGAVFLAGFFGLLYWFSRGKWIGAGDIKLGIFLGLLVPAPQTLALFFLSYIIGAIVSVGLLIFGGKHWGSRLPFGTFLTSGAFIGMLWGEELINWYFRLIGI